MCYWLVPRRYCSRLLALWDQLCMHNIEMYLPLVALCWLQGGITWEIQVLGVPVVVLWSHSLGGSIGEVSSGFGLEWGAGTCGALPLHILAWICPVCLPCSPSSV